MRIFLSYLKRLKFLPLSTILLIVFSGAVFATEATPEPYIDFGNTAWMIMASALVLLMTAPGLALFYGGLVKRKNILSILMQSFLTLSLVSVIWVVVGYSLAFGPGTTIMGGKLSGFIGGFDWAFLKNVAYDTATKTFAISPYYISQETARIPHLVFMLFQMMFAIITPALIIGAFAERMKFSAFMVFTFFWSLLIYAPVAHMVWSADGWLFKLGALDFAGGTVVHINAGIAALVIAVLIGKRKNLKPTPPHNLVFTMIGASLLWFGWFGFNAGSGLAADGLAASAFMVTNTASAAAALMWAFMDWLFHKKPTMLGAATGAVAGLVAITPAAGFVDVSGALIIGLSVSVICYFFVVVVKNIFKYDDALDAFGVHGIGGVWGAIATGILATPFVQSSYKGLIHGNPEQLKIQIMTVIVVAVYSLVGTVIIYKIIDFIIGMRVSSEDESIGLDVSEHNERAYTILE